MASAAVRRGAISAVKHLAPEALITAGKKGSMYLGKEYGNDLIKDQIRMYERDVTDQGRAMLPQFMRESDNAAMGVTSDIIADNLGLMKYAQDNTIQPWIDLGVEGYNNFRNGGLIPEQAPKPRARNRFDNRNATKEPRP